MVSSSDTKKLALGFEQTRSGALCQVQKCKAREKEMLTSGFEPLTS
jgi:hypothetical protein